MVPSAFAVAVPWSGRVATRTEAGFRVVPGVALSFAMTVTVPVAVGLTVAVPFAGAATITMEEIAAGPTTASFRVTSMGAAVFASSVSVSGTATGGDAGFMGSPGRMTTSSLSLPPAADSTLILAGGLAVAGSTFLYSPPFMG